VITPDFSVGCIEYADGIVARVTCGLVAAAGQVVDNHRRRRCDFHQQCPQRWVKCLCEAHPSQPPACCYRAPHELVSDVVRVMSTHGPWVGREWRLMRNTPWYENRPVALSAKASRFDFCRGPAEIAEAFGRSGRAAFPRNWIARYGSGGSPSVSERFSGRRRIESSFAPIQRSRKRLETECCLYPDSLFQRRTLDRAVCQQRSRPDPFAQRSDRSGRRVDRRNGKDP